MWQVWPFILQTPYSESIRGQDSQHKYSGVHIIWHTASRLASHPFTCRLLEHPSINHFDRIDRENRHGGVDRNPDLGMECWEQHNTHRQGKEREAAQVLSLLAAKALKLQPTMGGPTARKGGEETIRHPKQIRTHWSEYTTTLKGLPMYVGWIFNQAVYSTIPPSHLQLDPPTVGLLHQFYNNNTPINSLLLISSNLQASAWPNTLRTCSSEFYNHQNWRIKCPTQIGVYNKSICNCG